ncbi:NAD(P)-dependent oxidoreductase [Anaerorhabdus furcosa]|uniref:3-hydroxyisobutyrate dehydrogenase n=1 Tax=Anaerorhabdus furcosa TaxID=118967 RepID=A0A1T4P539_9FIRM|nr:NAD(P)-dependent oxidoreductase [Anaerorhabdus furcosa]SJZ86633.1 3-hydroxyisobutyrate dehydrogenase [Anaerorhabdus furcosa]
MKIGFIGTGLMGASMVRNLLKNNHEVTVYNRTVSKAKALETDGAIFCETIEACVAERDVIIMIVGLPSDVEEVSNQVFKFAKTGAILIDMTTSSPKLAEKLTTEGLAKGIAVLDAPVSGGDIGAKNGTLSIMVGGEQDAFTACLPIFECMGKNIVYCGHAGCGQHTKMANQIAIAGTVSGVAEAIAYANKMGLDSQIMLNAISAGAAGSWQMSNNGPKMISKDYDPGFFIKHFVKDMNIAIQCADEEKLDLPILKIVRDLYQDMMIQGDENLGTQAIIKQYEK